MAGVIPTLFVNQLEISSPADTLAYLLRFLFNNPGWTSSQIEPSLLSLRKFISTNTENIDTLPSTIQNVLDAAVKRYYPTYNVTVSNKKISTATYNLEIVITDQLGVPIFSANDFVIENGEFKLISEIRKSAMGEN